MVHFRQNANEATGPAPFAAGTPVCSRGNRLSYGVVWLVATRIDESDLLVKIQNAGWRNAKICLGAVHVYYQLAYRVQSKRGKLMRVYRIHSFNS